MTGIRTRGSHHTKCENCSNSSIGCAWEKTSLSHEDSWRRRSSGSLAPAPEVVLEVGKILRVYMLLEGNFLACRRGTSAWWHADIHAKAHIHAASTVSPITGGSVIGSWPSAMGSTEGTRPSTSRRSSTGTCTKPGSYKFGHRTCFG
jgi:hypothetical protein